MFAASGGTLFVGSLFGTISAWSAADMRRPVEGDRVYLGGFQESYAMKRN